MSITLRSGRESEEDEFNAELDFKESEAEALLQIAKMESEEEAKKRDTEAARISADFELYKDATRRKIDRLQWTICSLQRFQRSVAKTPALPSEADTKHLKRKKGKAVHHLERRAFLHTYRVCQEERTQSQLL